MPEGHSHFNKLLDTIDWVVYAKPPFSNSEDILNYLGRYTHKIAISNYRILACDNEWITFKWRDYSDGNKSKIMRLKPEEFIRRFLSHVVPNGFMRIRSFGFLANACKANKIEAIQKQLKHKPKKAAKKKNVEILMLELTGKDITLCPVCKQGKLKRIREIQPKLSKMLFDTS